MVLGQWSWWPWLCAAPHPKSSQAVVQFGAVPGFYHKAGSWGQQFTASQPSAVQRQSLSCLSAEDRVSSPEFNNRIVKVQCLTWTKPFPPPSLLFLFVILICKVGVRFAGDTEPGTQSLYTYCEFSGFIFPEQKLPGFFHQLVD